MQIDLADLVLNASVEAPESLADDVRRHAAVRLARFTQPTRIEVVEQLPLRVTGTVRKGRLRGMERRRTLGLLE